MYRYIRNAVTQHYILGAVLTNLNLLLCLHINIVYVDYYDVSLYIKVYTYIFKYYSAAGKATNNELNVHSNHTRKYI